MCHGDTGISIQRDLIIWQKKILQNAPQNTTVSLVESNNNQTSPRKCFNNHQLSLLRLEQHIAKKKIVRLFVVN